MAKVALVHDWLTNLAGAERVLIALHETFPEAPIYTSVFVPDLFEPLDGADVRTSFLQRVPFARRKHQAFPFFRTLAFEGFDLSEYDIVISSCHAEAKGVLTSPETLHICYCYTPVRYYWGGYNRYRAEPRFGVLNPLVRTALPLMTGYLRLWDRCAADRVDRFVATCGNVAARIEKYYRRDAQVIYPPVDVRRLPLGAGPGEYYLVVGRHVPYKRTDLAIEVFNRMGLPLVIVGEGSELNDLRRQARSNVTFLGHVSDAELSEVYARARALVFPQDEDFGITPLESMAAGRPVIAYRSGGALETVVEGETGVFFDRQEPASLETAVRSLEEAEFKPLRLRSHAMGFDVTVFRKRIEEYALREWEAFRAPCAPGEERRPALGMAGAGEDFLWG